MLEKLSVGDYVCVLESDEYANGRITFVGEDGAIVVRPLLPSEKIENIPDITKKTS